MFYVDLRNISELQTFTLKSWTSNITKETLQYFIDKLIKAMFYCTVVLPIIKDLFVPNLRPKTIYFIFIN